MENERESNAIYKEYAYIRKDKEKVRNLGTPFPETPADYSQQTFAIHEYFYGWMCDFRPTWQTKWDTALAQCEWEKISKLMHAIYALLPEEEQTILDPAMPQLTPWEDDMKMYWPTVWILDKHGARHGRIAMQIYARSKDEALKKIPKGYELKSW
jgi:tRNA U34 5-methylaminomethyl-2-thiouridine-forming methyltransferase MnmC